MGRKFNDLWPHVLVQYGDTYGHVLRLAAIYLLLIPLDTHRNVCVYSLS